MNEGKQLNCYQLQDFLHSVKIRTGIAQSVKNPFVKTPKDDQKEVEITSLKLPMVFWCDAYGVIF